MMNYSSLKPIFASAVMRIVKIEKKLCFSNIITYDYKDLGNDPLSANYRSYLQISRNLQSELEISKRNLQDFLDQEENLVNQKLAPQKIIHCSINFRDKTHPFIQWVINFEGLAKDGINIYENYVEPETLEYPIYSLYEFCNPLIVKSVTSSLEHQIDPNHRIIEYFGDVGDDLDGYDAIKFL